MDISPVLAYLASLHPIIPMVLAILGALVVVAQVVVAITPTPADDNFMAKLEAIPVLGALLKALKSFAPIQKK